MSARVITDLAVDGYVAALINVSAGGLLRLGTIDLDKALRVLQRTDVLSLCLLNRLLNFDQ